MLEAALSKQHVVAITCKKSGRVAYEFSFSGTTHLCFLSPSFCTCDEVIEAYLKDQPEPIPVCKHVFAAKLAVAAGTLCIENVSEADFSNRVLSVCS